MRDREIHSLQSNSPRITNPECQNRNVPSNQRAKTTNLAGETVDNVYHMNHQNLNHQPKSPPLLPTKNATTIANEKCRPNFE
jgi:hypothetical protein